MFGSLFWKNRERERRISGELNFSRWPPTFLSAGQRISTGGESIGYDYISVEQCASPEMSLISGFPYIHSRPQKS